MGAENEKAEEASGGEFEVKAKMVERVPERIVRKLARVAALSYRDGVLGGGLCEKIEEKTRRMRALMVLGLMVGSGVGEGSTDRALEKAGVSWLDVVGWCEEDPEYGALWEAVEKVRLKAAAAAAFDKLMDRAINGYDAQEARSTREGVEVVTVRKYDNSMAVQLLKSVGYVGAREPAVKEGGGRKVRGKEVAAAPKEGEAPAVEGEDESEGVMFPDRASAFRAMGGEPAVGSGVAVNARVAGK